MVQLGRALTDPDLRPPVMALYVYNSNPAAVCPNSSLVLEGLAREDLFTVVHEQVQTDTADYADLLLPATTSMEHRDVYRSFGHLYLQLAEPVISPRGGGPDRTGRCSGSWPAPWGCATAHYETPLPELIDAHLRAAGPVADGVTHERLRAEHSARIAVPRPFLPFADGAPTPSGRVEFYSETLAQQGLPPLPTYVPLRESRDNPAIGPRYPLRCHVPPNRFFLNSSFSQSALLRARQGGPTVLVHPEDAAARRIDGGRPGRGLQRPGPGALHRGPVGRHPARPGGHRRDLVAQVHAGGPGGQRPHLGWSRRHGWGPGVPLHDGRGGVGPIRRRRPSPAMPSVSGAGRAGVVRGSTPGGRLASSSSSDRSEVMLVTY